MSFCKTSIFFGSISETTQMRVTFGVKDVGMCAWDPIKKTLGLIGKFLRYIDVGTTSLPFQAKFTLNLDKLSFSEGNPSQKFLPKYSVFGITRILYPIFPCQQKDVAVHWFLSFKRKQTTPMKFVVRQEPLGCGITFERERRGFGAEWRHAARRLRTCFSWPKVIIKSRKIHENTLYMIGVWFFCGKFRWCVECMLCKTMILSHTSCLAQIFAVKSVCVHWMFLLDQLDTELIWFVYHSPENILENYGLPLL